MAGLYKITQGFPVGANVHVSDLAYADDIVILSSSYSEMQGLLEAVNRHAAAVGMRINASKTEVMSALIPGEQHQAVLLDGEPLENVDTFKSLSSEAGLILPVPYSLTCNHGFGYGVLRAGLKIHAFNQLSAILLGKHEHLLSFLG